MSIKPTITLSFLVETGPPRCFFWELRFSTGDRRRRALTRRSPALTATTSGSADANTSAHTPARVMGGSGSRERFLAAPLSRQHDFPFTVNQCFCKSRSTTIALRDNFWGNTTAVSAGADDEYVVKDVTSGRALFHVTASIDGAAHDPKTKWLLDAYKIPVAHLTEAWTYTTAYNLHVGKEETYYITQLEIQYLPMHNNPCFAEFQNLDTGKRSRVGVHGLWRQRTVFIYLDPEVTGERQAIAKVFRPNGNTADFGNNEYHVQVAPGVDIAFIVLVCGAMDDALQQSLTT